MKLTRLAESSIACIGGLLLVACGELHPCPDVPCSPVVRVAISIPEDDVDSEYRVEMTADGVRSECTVSMGAEPLAPGKSRKGECDTEDVYLEAKRPKAGATCDEDACQDFPPDLPRLLLSVGGSPSVVELSVDRNGENGVNKTIKPTYQKDYPLPECGPSCGAAGEYVKVTWK